MKYADLLIAIGSADKSFTNLGGRSKFKARAEDGKIIITNSSNRAYKVNAEFYNRVKARYDQLPAGRKEMTSEYTNPKWNDCPGTIQAPYIPAIFTQV